MCPFYIIKMKKKEGTVGRIGIPLFTILALGILLISTANSMGDIEKKRQVDEVCRKYALVMETDGKLVEGVKNKLISELTSIGVKEISLEGTTFNDVKYGDEIKIVLNGSIDFKKTDITGFFNMKNSTETIQLKNKVYKSISKR